MKKICVIGLGYIGLPTSGLLASRGFQVYGVDLNEKIVRALNEGKALIHEPSLDELVKAGVESGRLSASLRPQAADIFIIAVPTPFKEGHKPDLSHVEAAARSIAPYLLPGNLVILESTSPVGTTENICRLLRELRPDLAEASAGLLVAYCPERVLPGRILQELTDNDRVVGGVDEASTQAAEEFYKSFVRGEVLPTSAGTAELVKLTENSYRDVNIAFANELSLICAQLGINVWETIRLANRHPRVNILRPGPGVGGHCIAVDPWFLVDSAPERARLVQAARLVNDGKPEWVLEQALAAAAKLTAPCAACLGLAFKPDIDDLRESPAVYITGRLAEEKKLSVLAVEPYIQALPPGLSGRPNLRTASLEEALEQADIVLILVGHKIFKSIRPERLRGKTLIDACGLLEQSE